MASDFRIMGMSKPQRFSAHTEGHISSLYGDEVVSLAGSQHLGSSMIPSTCCMQSSTSLEHHAAWHLRRQLRHQESKCMVRMDSVC